MKTFLLLAIAFLMPLTLHAGVFENLQAYYSFDAEDGTDASNNGLDLTLVGDVGFESGLFGRGLAPNGDIGKYATRPVDDASLNFGPNNFTVQAWVKYQDLNGEQILLEKFSGCCGPGWTLTKLSDQSLGFAFAQANTALVRSAPLEIALGTWHHVVIRRTGNLFELLFNNQIMDSVTSDQAATTSAPLLIGRRNSQDGRDFTLEGAID